MIVTVFRKEHFNAAHRLNNPEWSIDKNREIFGLCNNNNFHGHNYTLVVKLKGETDPETGYLMDLKILKDLIHEEVIEPFDHSNLNLDLTEFKNLNPTAENIAFVIWNKLRKRIDHAIKLGVILYETERNYVEYEGE
jgi:6-pyruvoyltetrahydropterin/6-carboxytetrahydropterin synthase